MEWHLYFLAAAAGVGCGFVNAIAGSGSLITLPILIFLGLPPTVANGTNRVAILMQNVVGVASFRSQGALDWARGKWLLLPAVVGALLGARIAVSLDERAMRLAIAAVMVLMLGLLLLKPKRWLEGAPVRSGEGLSWREGLAFFAIGIYGGFIQAGVGLFLLAALVLVSGYDLVRGNAVKLLIVLAFTPFALLVFLLNDQVNWPVGLTMGVGNMLGVWLGARTAVKRGAGFLRWALIAVVAISAVKLLWDALAV